MEPGAATALTVCYNMGRVFKKPVDFRETGDSPQEVGPVQSAEALLGKPETPRKTQLCPRCLQALATAPATHQAPRLPVDFTLAAPSL